MLSMLNGHFKGVFSSDRLTPPLSDLRILSLPDVIEFSIDVHDLLVLLLLCEGTSHLSLRFRKRIYLPLHSIYFKGA